jgi:hypothetical protein
MLKQGRAKRVLIGFFLSLVLLFGLSCSPLDAEDFLIPIPQEEKELLFDLSSSGLSTSDSLSYRLNFCPNSYHPNYLDMVLVDECGDCPPYLIEVNTLTKQWTASKLFDILPEKEAKALGGYLIFNEPVKIDLNRNILASYFYTLYYIDRQNKTYHSVELPFHPHSIDSYIISENKAYVAVQDNVYSIDYPSLALESLQKVFSFSNVGTLLYADAEAIYLDAQDMNPEASLSNGLMRVDLDTLETEFLLNRPEEENKSFYYRHSEKYWLIYEFSGRNEEDGSYQVRTHAIEQADLSYACNFEVYGQLRQVNSRLMIYWIENHQLYSWKTPLE